MKNRQAKALALTSVKRARTRQRPDRGYCSRVTYVWCTRKFCTADSLGIVVALVILFRSTDVHAEVMDKVPSAVSLEVFSALELLILTVVALALRQALARFLGSGVIAGLTVPLLVELRFSDIAQSVAVEGGMAYVCLAWMPTVIALAAIALQVTVSLTVVRSSR